MTDRLEDAFAVPCGSALSGLPTRSTIATAIHAASTPPSTTVER
jgi:hypothetical protein